ncbi:MAG TPA: hypothetical protein VJ385_03480 [Fibrobacteria bacterium]|nr:hypothetical protein [Fibrobacteria bacterium]
MNAVRDWFRAATLSLRAARVYALVGRAGTGKSYRARSVAERHGIGLIIDDGLLIREGTVLAGRSAKKEGNSVSATKVAVFEDRDHRREVADRLWQERFTSLLILGTSEKMIRRIMRRLGLGTVRIHRVLPIESLASAAEIEFARDQRNRSGAHVVPVPAIEVKTSSAFRIFDSLRILLHRHQILSLPDKVIEQTVVYPAYGRKGVLAISDGAILQMVRHCLRDFSPGVRTCRSAIRRTGNAYHIDLGLVFPHRLAAPGTLSGLQRFLEERIGRATGITTLHFHLTLERIAEAPPEPAAPLRPAQPLAPRQARTPLAGWLSRNRGKPIR